MMVQVELGSGWVAVFVASQALWTIQRLSSVCNAHSIISAMMSARAGGPRNTHQRKDYPSFQRLLVCHLVPIPTAAPSGRPLPTPFPLPFSSSLHPLLCRLMGKMICDAKNKLPGDSSMTEPTGRDRRDVGPDDRRWRLQEDRQPGELSVLGKSGCKNV